MVSARRQAPVGAHYGMRDWLLQRMTALVIAIYTVGLAACLVWHAPASHGEWRMLFSGTFTRVATMLFFVALAYHAWVGMRDILMDYARPAGLRLLLQSAVVVALVFYVLWAAAVLWGR